MANESNERKAQGGSSIALGVASLGVAAILLIIAARQPAQTICDPIINLPIMAFAAAQAAFVLALGSFRRAGLPPLLGATIPLAWALLAGATLALREAAGDFDAIGSGNALMAAATVLGFFLMLHGMGMKLETSGSLAWLVVPVLALGLSLGWLRVLEDGTPQRTWRSWRAVNDWAEALATMEKAAGGVPRSDASIDAVIAALEPTHARNLPKVDGWGRELEYVSDGKVWEISSLGAFGEHGPTSAGPVRGFADDLVLASTGILSWPENPCDELAEAQVEELRTEPPPDGRRDELPAPPGTIDKRHEKD